MKSGARYYVVHETRYDYGAPVSLSRQLVRLQPRELPFQLCEGFDLAISPEPDALTRGHDAFGNNVLWMSIESDHTSLDMRVAYWATILERSIPPEVDTPPWEDVRERLTYHAGRRLPAEDFLATRFLFESPRVRNKREIAAWAAPCFPAGAPLLSCVRMLAEHIHAELVFDPRATTASTPVTEVFSRRRGVCQDFAHLMLSCLRSMGLAGRYVSGYVLTRPPPGRARLVGADASHAWVSVYCPDHGWIDVDPTNALLVGTEHVTIGWGRDFDDVSPMRGVLLGGGSHAADISVTVAPAEEYDALFGPGAPRSGRPRAAE
jgi:transglutaminase-like putative cysteine protease